MSAKDPDNFGENNDEFGEEDKIKPVNETSNFKGKSCFKKDRDKDASKAAVKIVEPEKQKEDESKEEFKERRKRKPQFKTVKEPSELKNSEYLTLNGNEGDILEPDKKKFIRKGKRSTTL